MTLDTTRHLYLVDETQVVSIGDTVGSQAKRILGLTDAFPDTNIAALLPYGLGEVFVADGERCRWSLFQG
jgi:hypothetical protein